MSTKNKPGIHLYNDKRPVDNKKTGRFEKYVTEWYWNIVASNGQEVARSTKTYTRKSGAVKSIKVAAIVFNSHPGWNMYYDHSKHDSPLQSYL